jgi:hypothetical protein
VKEYGERISCSSVVAKNSETCRLDIHVSGIGVSNTWRLSDRYERLVAVAMEVFPRHAENISQVSVLDTSSSPSAESIA